MIGAFFDVDGTLYTANVWRDLIQYARAHGRARAAQLYYYTLVPWYFMCQLKLVSEEAFRQPWVMNMGGMLKGWSQAQGDAAFEWIAAEFTFAPHCVQPHIEFNTRLRALQCRC